MNANNVRPAELGKQLNQNHAQNRLLVTVILKKVFAGFLI